MPEQRAGELMLGERSTQETMRSLSDGPKIKIHLGPPKPDDAAALAVLCGQLGYDATADQVAQRLVFLSGRGDHCVYVARDHRQTPLGWIHAFISRHLQSEPYVEVGGMVVGESERGAGIGAALLAGVEAWARAAGLELIRVRSNVVRGRAHRFYERQAYAKVKTSHVFEKRLR